MGEALGAGMWQQLDNIPKYRTTFNSLDTNRIGKAINTLTANTGTFQVHTNSVSYNMTDAITFTN